MNRIALLIASGMLLGIGNGMMCRVEPPCTPLNPDYDPATGRCDGGDADTNDDGDGIIIVGGDADPPLPGTGGVPTEPDTPPAADPNGDPDAVDLMTYGLNGRWLDNGRIACLTHTGSGVVATYVLPHTCDHADGTGAISETIDDFTGQLSGDTITGMTSVCRHGFDDTEGNGFVQTTMTLTVSADGKTLSGTWHNSDTDEEVPFLLTRETVGNCQGGPGTN